MSKNLHKTNCQELLRDLKSTVEGLLVGQLDNVWCVYGGLNRLHNDVSYIFKHGCKTTNPYNYSCFWNFIQGLEWLQPNISKLTFSLDCEYKQHIPSHIRNDKAAIWLYRNLENHSLSQKLSWLLSDKTHLLSCYETNAFLCQKDYSEALLICLRAIERNHSNLLSEINPCLFLRVSDCYKVHRRCFSFPETHLKIIRQHDGRETRTKLRTNFTKIRLWKSMPILQSSVISLRERSKSSNQNKPSTCIRNIEKFHPNLQERNETKKDVKHIMMDIKKIVEHMPSPSSSNNSERVNYIATSLPEQKYLTSARSKLDYNFLESLSGIAGEKDFKKKPKKTFIEDGGMSVLPMSTGFFPRPTKGQSLSEFLSSGQFARANAELDRENAHFSISEAMIAAMEQLKCRKNLNLADEQIDESDEEIRGLKQRIRLRRREKLVEKQRRICFSLLSDGKTDTTTTEPSDSSSSSSLYYTSDSVHSDEDVEDLQMDEASNLTDNLGLSMSMASLYSESDLLKRPRGAPDGASDILSAEGVALSLISRFNDKHLPRASDLEWLVSEEDAPQALLPLPKSWPVSPDGEDNDNEGTSLRGTREWAPPRPQIIFTLYSPPNRSKLMAKQSHRCAGCGMRVAPQYASRFRYCNYLGRYFCTGCHTNQLSLIPARILHKWDFTRYIVSTFSYRLLEQMYSDPLFRIFELNKNIEKRCKNLEICKKYRLGLYYLKDFILTCRFADMIQDTLITEPSYLYSDPEIYSINDLVNVRTGELKSKLKYLVELCCRHVIECQLCSARGFICEICNSSDVLFPWQMKIVQRCPCCGSCYHTNCWKISENSCVKCKRKASRHNIEV